MKQMLLLLCFVPLTVQALDRPQLDKMLATAVSAKGRPYWRRGKPCWIWARMPCPCWRKPLPTRVDVAAAIGRPGSVTSG